MIQTTTLKTSQLLKEAGFKQDTGLYWFAFGNGIHEWQLTNNILSKENIKGWRAFEKSNKETIMYAAPITDELLSELPAGTMSKSKVVCQFEINMFGKPRKYRVQYRCLHKDTYNDRCTYLDLPLDAICNESLPEALASMWLHLKKENLI